MPPLPLLLPDLNGCDEVCLALALLRDFNLSGTDDTCLDHLATKGGSLLRGNVTICGDVSGDSDETFLVEVGYNSFLNRLVGEGGLGGLGLAVSVALVELLDGGGGELYEFIGEGGVGADSFKEFTVSHITTFLPHYAVDAKFFIQ